QRAAGNDRVRQEHPGSDRGAADQLAPPVRIVRQPRESTWRAGDREPHFDRGPRRTERARPQAEGAEALCDEHRRGGRRRRTADGRATGWGGRAPRALHLRMVKKGTAEIAEHAEKYYLCGLAPANPKLGEPH